MVLQAQNNKMHDKHKPPRNYHHRRLDSSMHSSQSASSHAKMFSNQREAEEQRS